MDYDHGIRYTPAIVRSTIDRTVTIDAVKELESGWFSHIQHVHVEAEVSAGVSYVGGVGHRFDIPCHVHICITVLNSLFQQENSATALKWTGDLFGLFVGQHQFYYQPSQKTPGHTTFLQKEDFTGPLSYFVREGSSGGASTKTNFEGFNKSLKASFEK